MEDDKEPTEESELTWGDRLIHSDVLSPRQKKVCELAAQGISNKKIAEQLGYTDAWISTMLSNTMIRAEVDRIRDKIYEESIGKRLKDLSRPALDELERCLADKSNRYKEALKVDVAKFLVEKLDGKAVQKHDIGDNLLSVMMDRLDALKGSGQKSLSVIDVTINESNGALDVAKTEDGLQIQGELPVQRSKSEEDMLRDWVISFDNEKKS